GDSNQKQGPNHFRDSAQSFQQAANGKGDEWRRNISGSSHRQGQGAGHCQDGAAECNQQGFTNQSRNLPQSFRRELRRKHGAKGLHRVRYRDQVRPMVPGGNSAKGGKQQQESGLFTEAPDEEVNDGNQQNQHDDQGGGAMVVGHIQGADEFCSNASGADCANDDGSANSAFKLIAAIGEQIFETQRQ